MKAAERIDGIQVDDLVYKNLYKLGAAAALIAALAFRRNMDAEYMLARSMGIIKVGPTTVPGNTADWFALLQNHRLIGLTLLNLFDLVNYALVGLIFLALWAALRKTSPAGTALATALSFVGVAAYFASNQALGLLSLSSRYTSASSELQREAYLAAGQAGLAIHQANSFAGVGIYPSFLLVSLAGLLLSTIMLHSSWFGKGAAFTGILANAIGLSYYLALIFTPSLTFLPLSISALFLLAWYVLIAVRLWKFRREGRAKRSISTAQPSEAVYQ